MQYRLKAIVSDPQYQRTFHHQAEVRETLSEAVQDLEDLGSDAIWFEIQRRQKSWIGWKPYIVSARRSDQ